MLSKKVNGIFLKNIVHLWLLMSCCNCVKAGILPLTFIRHNNIVEQTNNRINDNISNIIHKNNNDNNNLNNNNINNFGYIEYQPNGTLLLQTFAGAPENATTENLLLFKTIIKAIKLTPKLGTAPNSKLNIKIYGEGIEHKFPPFLERIIQRIQSYFSVYRYTDTSKPVRLDKPTETEASILTTTVVGIEGSGNAGLQTTTLSDNDSTEFISIGENDDFITVGQD